MYNIRVYGLLIENNAVLVSDELYQNIYMTKFPGGGHEVGESLTDCLKREFKEELKLDINVISHFYTTDFYVASIFNPEYQLISIYYLVEKVGIEKVNASFKKFDFEHVHGAQSIRWVPFENLEEAEFTFPIDKKVVTMLKNSYYL